MFGSAQAGNFKNNECFIIGYAKAESGVISNYRAPLAQVYKNIDKCVEYLELPFARLMKMVSNNKIDAIMGRSMLTIIGLPVLPYIPTPVATFKAYFVTSPSAAEKVKQGIENLAQYNVGGLTGAGWSVETLGRLSEDFKYADNLDQLLSMYTHKRLDGFLVTELFLPHVMQSLFKDKVAAFQTVLLYDVPVYHVLAPKHANLVDALDASINEVLAQISESAALSMVNRKMPL